MGILGDDGKHAVTDLRAFIGKKKPAKPWVPTEAEHSADVRPVAPVATPEPVTELPPAEVRISEFAVVEEADDVETELEIDGDEDWNPDEPPVKQEEYFGLSECFFTHQTIEQNQIIARSPIGAM